MIDGGCGRTVGDMNASPRSARRFPRTISLPLRVAAAGFAIVETMPEQNFGKELTGEIWEMRF